MDNKTLLVIGAGPFQLALAQKAAELCDVKIAAPVISDDFLACASETLIADVRDLDAILDFARDADGAARIDGAITDETDIPVLTVAQVCEALGLSGIDADTARLFTNKSLMRQKMQELGIPVLANRTVFSLDEAKQAYDEIGGVVIIKPVDTQGSRGVQICRNVDELVEKYPEAARWSSDASVIVERYATGREFVVEGLALNGEFINLCVGDTLYFDLGDSLSAKERTFPTVADDALRDRVLELNTRIIKGFGLKQGITHSEFVMDGDDIFLMETAARGGGAFISSDLIPLSCGLRSEEFLVRLALGEMESLDQLPGVRPFDAAACPDELAKEPLCHCCYVAFYVPMGEVLAVRGVDEVLALPYVHRTQIEHLDELVGTNYAHGHTDKTSRYLVTLEAPSREELERRMAHVRATIQMDVRMPDGSIEGLIWE